MSHVLVEDHGAVRHVVLDRPEKRNAFDDQMIDELGEALRRAGEEPAVRVVVLRGTGRMFSAGVDIDNLHRETPQNVRAIRRRMMEVWNLPEELPQPVVARIHGAAIGGALELALACDLRVMAEDAVAGLPEVGIGLVPDLGGTTRLPAVVGVGRAKDMVLTRRMVSGEEALRIGLVERAGPAEGLDGIVDTLVAELLGGGPVAQGRAKRIVDASARPTLATSFEMEASAQERCTATEDFAEGVRALSEKRAPVFSGR